MRSDNSTVLILFYNIMPNLVKIGLINYNVRDYVPKATEMLKLPKDGAQSEHDYGKCATDAKSNCGGALSAAYGDCVVQNPSRGSTEKY